MQRRDGFRRVGGGFNSVSGDYLQKSAKKRFLTIGFNRLPGSLRPLRSSVANYS